MMTAAQKKKYYSICGQAGTRLTDRGLPDLNLEQCEYICETLLAGGSVTYKELKTRAFPEKMEKESSPDPGLFD